jgi:hypothetical protein
MQVWTVWQMKTGATVVAEPARGRILRRLIGFPSMFIVTSLS